MNVDDKNWPFVSSCLSKFVDLQNQQLDVLNILIERLTTQGSKSENCYEPLYNPLRE